MNIEKKVWPRSFERLLSGEASFELRLADFECKPGDTMVLKEWDPQKKQFTGRKIEKRVATVIKQNPSEFYTDEQIKKFGLQIIGFE